MIDIIVSGSRDGSFALWDLRCNFSSKSWNREICIGLVMAPHFLWSNQVVYVCNPNISSFSFLIYSSFSTMLFCLLFIFSIFQLFHSSTAMVKRAHLSPQAKRIRRSKVYCWFCFCLVISLTSSILFIDSLIPSGSFYEHYIGPLSQRRGFHCFCGSSGQVCM